MLRKVLYLASSTMLTTLICLASVAAAWPTGQQVFQDLSPSPGVLALGPESCDAGDKATRILLATSKPSRAYTVPGDFIGFGFETAFLNEYSHGTFSENLVNAVAKRVGERLTIRSGGTSGDLLIFDPDLNQTKVCISGDCPVGSGATFIMGPSYFQGFSRFKNQKFSFQAPLGPDLNLTKSVQYVTRAYAAAGADRVAAIAIGNEPDLYASDHGFRYTAKQYAEDAIKLQKEIIAHLGLTGDDARIFEVADLAGYGNFDIPSVFDNGVNTEGHTKYAASHYYQLSVPPGTYDPPTEQRLLMNHSAITHKFHDGYTAAQAYIERSHPSVDYIISESGSSLAGPPREFQDAFGAALWLADYNLHAMALGVKRVHNTMRPATNHSLWVPDDSANDPAYGREYSPGPQVRGPYHALPMLADFISADSGAVVEVLDTDTATAYALHDPASWALKRLAIVNLRYWSADQRTERGSSVFAIPVGNGANVTVARLRADAGARAQGYDVEGDNGTISWAGETWSYALDNGNGRYTGAPQSEDVRVCGGSALVRVWDTEAVVVTVSL